MADPEVEVDAPSRRDALEAAYDAVEAPETPAPVEPVQAAPTDTTPPPTEGTEPRTAAEKARDEKGRFAQPAKTPTVTKRPTLNARPAVTPAPKPGAPTATAAPTPGALTAVKAPQSWKPAAREKWATLAPEVQQEVARRETEVNQRLRESADAQKQWGAFREATAPYEGVFRAEGGDATGAALTALQTSVALRVAPPAHKAAIVANIINTFGVPLEAINQYLQGGAPQGHQTPPPAPQQFRDPRFDQFIAERQAQVQQATASEVESFGADHEFIEDVRHEMADLLEVAARRGVALSLEDAYTRAVKLHPGVAEVMEQRDAATAATAAQAATQRARAASASVRSRPAGPSSAPAATGRRAQLEAAMEQHNR